MPTLHELWGDVLTEKNALLQDLTNLKEHLSKDFENLLAKPGLIVPIFRYLREHDPIFVGPGLAIVSRYDDVVDVLARDAEFSVTEIYEAKMERTTGPFVLGMADTPEYQRDRALMERGVRPEDMARITAFVSETASKLVVAGQAAGRLDVVGGLSRVVPSRLVGWYFGAPGPDEATQMIWMRAIFRDIFLNLANDAGMRAEADKAAAGLHAYLDELIAERKAELVADPDSHDDYISRLIRLELNDPASIDDTLIRELLGGIIVGTVDTNSKAIAQAIDQLLDRPDILAQAQEAARTDDPAFVKYVFEALRFNPQNPFLIRHCEADAAVGDGTSRRRTIPKGSLVIVGTWSAMFDEAKVEDPESFRLDRPKDVYLHFGHGQHTCFGRHIAGVLIPEVAKALLRAGPIRREGEIRYDGAFPDELMVTLDGKSANLNYTADDVPT